MFTLLRNKTWSADFTL